MFNVDADPLASLTKEIKIDQRLDDCDSKNSDNIIKVFVKAFNDYLGDKMVYFYYLYVSYGQEPKVSPMVQCQH